MKVYCLILVLFATAYCSYAEETHKNNSIKAMIIREIMKKVSSITLSSLANASDDKKELILTKIEQKLKKTAAGLTDGYKYVKLIMEEFKNRAFKAGQQNKTESVREEISNHENTENISRKKEIKKHVIPEIKSSKWGNDVLRTNVDVSSKEGSIETDKSAADHKTYDNQTKEHIIKDISDKIESMAKGYLRRSQTFEQKIKIFEKIKQRIVESSKRKHLLLHNQHNELKTYTNLITKGLELSMKKLLSASKSRRTADATESEKQRNLVDVNSQAVNMAHIDEYKTFFAELWNETSIDPRCDTIVEGMCYRIGSLHKLSCGDGKIISLEQLCDGASDCWNAADERNCTIQAIDKSRLAIALISDVDQSVAGKCFQPVIKNDMFLHHHRVVREMLEEQLRYLEKQKALEITKSKQQDDADDDDDNDVFYSNLISSVTKAVNSLSDVFQANLCTTRDEVIKEHNFTRKSIDPEAVDDFIDNDSINTQSKWSPKSCTCKNQTCRVADCDTRCRRICWQKYNLNIWQCQSITGGTGVSLDLLCDGKLDCFDESDETSCASDSSVTKYEANKLYKDLLDLLSLKTLSMEFELCRNKVVAQTGLVRQLQKLTTKFDVDLHAVRIVRDEYFKTLANIYGDMKQVLNLEELDDIYEFLRELNKKMIRALKLSHTGNEHVVTPAGCYCNNGTCVLVRCSRKCIATCQIEPLLTKYSCEDNQTSVLIKSVCNGKNDCPNKEDERGCQSEVCRAHHLVVLRHNLQRAGMTLKGTVLGDALDSWKTKVMSTLIVAKGSERPNHKVLADIILKVLRDLVTTYASIEETKKNSSNFVMSQFLNMSDIVKQTLKYCNK